MRACVRACVGLSVRARVGVSVRVCEVVSDRRIWTNSLSDYRITCLRCSDFRIHELGAETDFCKITIGFTEL